MSFTFEQLSAIIAANAPCDVKDMRVEDQGPLSKNLSFRQMDTLSYEYKERVRSSQYERHMNLGNTPNPVS